jgi:hypothetical protein
MSLTEALNPNTPQLPYVDGAIVASVTEGLAGADTGVIVELYGEATEADKTFGSIMNDTSEMYVDIFGMAGRTVGDFQTLTYVKNPIIDFMKGAVTARRILAEQYEANGGSLPEISPVAEVSFTQKQLADVTKTHGVQDYPTQLKDRLAASGCGESVLDALTSRSRSLLERIGALEVLLLYAEQAVAQEVTDSAEPRVNP